MTLYTLKELSKLLKMSESYLYKATERGVIPALRIGRALRYDDDCVRTFLQKCKEPVAGNQMEKENA
jgi:excisionase family DNA binding protein